MIEVKVPQLSESVAEATLLAWHKKEGEAVKRDENLIDIETDKVVLELPAPADGVLVKIIKKATATRSAGRGDRADRHRRQGAPRPRRRSRRSQAASAAAKPQTAPPAVMPAAQKIAAEKGIDTSQIQGTGRDGRVTKGDVLGKRRSRAACRQPAKPPLAAAAAAGQRRPAARSGRPEQRVPMSRLRQRIAERLVQSQSTAAILTTFNEVNMAAGDGAAQALPGALREGARREAGLHVVLREGGGARAEALPGGQRLDRRHRHRLPRLLRHRRRGRQPARPGGADPARRRPA